MLLRLHAVRHVERRQRRYDSHNVAARRRVRSVADRGRPDVRNRPGDDDRDYSVPNGRLAHRYVFVCGNEQNEPSVIRTSRKYLVFTNRMSMKMLRKYR